MAPVALRGSGAPRWLVPLAVLAADAVLLFGAVSISLRIPAVQVLTSLPERSRIEYGGAVDTVSALTPAFIADVLGGGDPPGGGGGVAAGTPAAPSQARPAPGPSGASAPPSGAAPDRHPPVNDDFRDARRVSSVPYEARTTTKLASRQQGEPATCGPAGGTLWYRFTAEEDVGLIADTFGSDHPTTVAVFSGPSLRSLDEIGCHRHPLGLSLLAFRAVGGRTYHFQVTAPTQRVDAALERGNLVFRLAPQGRTLLASTGQGGPGNAPSEFPSISADGRYVAFRSGASNLDPRHPGGPCLFGSVCGQIYVHDLKTGRTAMVSISSLGLPGDAPSGLGPNGFAPPVLSADGRLVAFTSNATNLVPADTNACPSPETARYPALVPGTCPDVFIHDRDADGDHVFDEDPRLDPGAISTSRVSVSSTGGEGDDASDSPSISADGRFVAFASRASNLTPGASRMCRWRDTVDPPFPDYNCIDVFVHDRLTGRTVRISESPSGRPGNGDSGGAVSAMSGVGVAISADGRHVVFYSQASNLVAGDRNGKRDVFVRDLREERTVRVSASSSGGGGAKPFSGVAVSADGRYVAFDSEASHLAPGDRNGAMDVFVHDRDADGDGRFDEAGATSLEAASVSSTGRLGNGHSSGPVLSRDGRYLAFGSLASNLVPGDSNGRGAESKVGRDMFLRDLHRGVTIRISVSSEGAEATGGGSGLAPYVSADGRTFVWDSEASDLTKDHDPAVWDVYVHRLVWR